MDDQTKQIIDSAMQIVNTELIDTFDAATKLGIQIAYFGRLIRMGRYDLDQTYVKGSQELFGKRMFYRRSIEAVAKTYKHDRRQEGHDESANWPT